MRSVIACVFLLAAPWPAVAAESPAVTNLQGQYRDGQVFLTWKEAPSPLL